MLHKSEPKGLYFEIFTRQLPKNLNQRERITVMAVNSGSWFWLKSLWQGQFGEFPAIRLSGQASPRREATAHEIAYWERRTRLIMWLKGAQLLWNNMRMVREIYFHEVEPVRIGTMTQQLFQVN